MDTIHSSPFINLSMTRSHNTMCSGIQLRSYVLLILIPNSTEVFYNIDYCSSLF